MRQFWQHTNRVKTLDMLNKPLQQEAKKTALQYIQNGRKRINVFGTLLPSARQGRRGL